MISFSYFVTDLVTTFGDRREICVCYNGINEMMTQWYCSVTVKWQRLEFFLLVLGFSFRVDSNAAFFSEIIVDRFGVFLCELSSANG